MKSFRIILFLGIILLSSCGKNKGPDNSTGVITKNQDIQNFNGTDRSCKGPESSKQILTFFIGTWTPQVGISNSINFNCNYLDENSKNEVYVRYEKYTYTDIFDYLRIFPYCPADGNFFNQGGRILEKGKISFSLCSDAYETVIDGKEAKAYLVKSGEFFYYISSINDNSSPYRTMYKSSDMKNSTLRIEEVTSWIRYAAPL